MSSLLLSFGVASYVSQDVLIVPFQADFYEEVLVALQQDILLQLHINQDIKGLIIDLSKVILIDLKNIKSLEQTLNMASVLGVVGFLVGIQPSVTLALLQLGYEPSQLNTARNVENAMRVIHQNAHVPGAYQDEELQDEAIGDHTDEVAEDNGG